MSTFAERAGLDRLTGQELVDQLGAYLATIYQAVETRLLEEIADAVARDMNTEGLTRRAATIRELRIAAEKAIAAIDTEALARRIVEIATREGTAAAIEQLTFTGAATGGTAPASSVFGDLPFATGLTPGAALASAQIGVELASALTEVNQRILRAVPDIYQQTVARFVGERLLGGVTGRQLRQRAATEFLSQGIPGFVDSAGRRWKIGTYTEMATRTATNRAWISAHTERWAAMGLHLVTIVRGSDSCNRCAAWSGKVLSTDGTPAGVIQAEHATTGEPVDVVVAGTIADARAGGWNHPNCRCTLTPVFPGLSLPADDSTYDPQAEKDRERLRYLERRVRDFKRKQGIAAAMGDEVGAKQWGRLAREEQARIRQHIENTGQMRKPYRESLSYSDGAPETLPTVGPKAIER